MNETLLTIKIFLLIILISYGIQYYYDVSKPLKGILRCLRQIGIWLKDARVKSSNNTTKEVFDMIQNLNSYIDQVKHYQIFYIIGLLPPKQNLSRANELFLGIANKNNTLSYVDIKELEKLLNISLVERIFCTKLITIIEKLINFSYLLLLLSKEYTFEAIFLLVNALMIRRAVKFAVKKQAIRLYLFFLALQISFLLSNFSTVQWKWIMLLIVFFIYVSLTNYYLIDSKSSDTKK